MNRLEEVQSELNRLRAIIQELQAKENKPLDKKEGLTFLEVIASGEAFIRSKRNRNYPLWSQNFIEPGQTLCFTKEEMLADDWEVK